MFLLTVLFHFLLEDFAARVFACAFLLVFVLGLEILAAHGGRNFPKNSLFWGAKFKNRQIQYSRQHLTKQNLAYTFHGKL